LSYADSPLAPEYRFYVPAPGRFITCGAEETPIPLPSIPLPVERDAGANSEPTDKQLGASLYNYLRRFPDCPQAANYARLLKEAFPYYLSDIAAQIIMLEAKDVDAPYIRRKISYLKILLLLEPQNPQLLQKLGIACFELAMIYVELLQVRRELSRALSYLQRALILAPRDTTTLNYLGQINYLLGDYSSVLRFWQGVVDLLPACVAREQLNQRLEQIKNHQLPPHPLVDDLEAIGVATEHYAAREYADAAEIMNRIAENEVLPTALPSPEFYYFLGLCREKTDQTAAAFEAFTRALVVDPEHLASTEALQRITG